MDLQYRIIEVNADNLKDHPQAICFINPKHPFYHKKVEWLEEQFKMGLKIKLLYLEGEKNPVGFIEYVPGEFCWRPVQTKGYMFIHCLWTNGKKYQHQGLGNVLIDEVEKDAQKMSGVAVVTSDKSFMATREIFLKKGYGVVQELGKEQLLVKSFKEDTLPAINTEALNPSKYEGLTMIYSCQCPWIARFMEEVKPVLKEKGLNPEIIELRTPKDAQNAPSLYGVFNLIHNGKLLADRNISITRFINIVKKDIKRNS